MVLAAASSIVTGMVRDRTTGQPMPNLDVRIGNRHTTTNARGAYTLKGVGLGKQTITITSSDVPSQRFSVVVKRSVVHFNVRVCSMTLDYSCSSPSGSSSSG
jgi:hypothetical protein